MCGSLTLYYIMPRLNERQPDQKEENIRKALKSYLDSDRPSIRATAQQYGIPYSTFRGRIAGVQDRVGGHVRCRC